MDDLNFLVLPAKPSYDTSVALKYFKASGSAVGNRARFMASLRAQG